MQNFLGNNMEMEVFGGEGHCSIGYYTGWDNIKDLQSCLNQCLAEDQCKYVSFYEEESCSRYSNFNCGFRSNQFSSSKFYITYQKVQRVPNAQKGRTCYLCAANSIVF